MANGIDPYATVNAFTQTLGALGQNRLVRQQGQQFEDERQARRAAAEKDALYRNALMEYLGPVNAAVATGDLNFSQPGAPGVPPSAPDMGGNALSAPPTAAPDRSGQLNALYALDPERTNQLVQFQESQAQAQQAQAQAAQAQRQKQASEKILQADYIIDAASPSATLQIAFPAEHQAMVDAGVNVDDDEEVRAAMQQVRAHYGPIAGVGPTVAKEGEQFTLGEGQTRFDAKGKQIASVAPKADAEAANKDFERAKTLRAEFIAQNKEYTTTQAQYQNIVATAAKPSAAGDIALLTSYMKMLDPSSTVREGEFANAENAGSVPAKMRAQYNKLLTGERLTEGMRADFVSQAGSIFKSREDQYSKLRKKYTDFSVRTGIDPLDVVGPEEAPTAPSKPNEPARITNDAEYEALPSGAEFIAPDGSRRRKP